ncbi:Urb2/Npa2 family-domain-containing protein [Gaertneriomyces semiglobifer]|nr:Urb2/Npa2 family-domain-containing protein [Gaertneriomyces semiglobifer]
MGFPDVATDGTSSIEAITRRLRTSESGSAEGLEFAVEQWKSKSVFVPRKDELLLNWICSELRTPDGKAEAVGGIRTSLSIAHWRFFQTILNHFVSVRNGRGSSIGKHVLAPNMRVRVMDIFCGFAEGVRATVGTPDQNWLEIPALVQLVRACWDTLFVQLPEILRPTTDSMVALTESVIALFNATVDIESVNAELNPFTCSCLANLKKLSVQSVNHKKLFGTMVSKLLLPLLHLNDAVTSEEHRLQANGCAGVAEHVKILLMQTIFHTEHLPEFFDMFWQLNTQGSDPAFVKYTKLLLDCLSTTLCEGTPEDELTVLRSIPYLYELFVNACDNATHDRERGTQPPKFAMYQELYNLLQRYLQMPDVPNGDRRHRVLVTIGALLKVLHSNEVYKAANDDASKAQLSHFQMLNRTLLDSATIVSVEQRACLFDSWRMLLLLDYTIIQTHLDELWRWVLVPVKRETPLAASMSVFCIDLLKTFSKSRQLDELMKSLLESLRKMGWDKDLHAKDQLILFSEQCLLTFAECVELLLPAQVIALMTVLKDELLDHYIGSSAVTSPRKKSKTGHGRAENRSPVACGDIPVMLVSLVLQHAYISEGQKKVFEGILDDLHENFISPVLSESTLSQEGAARAVLHPALSLMGSFLKASQAYWMRHFTSDWVETVSTALSTASANDRILSCLLNEVAFSHIDRVASTTIDPGSDSACCRIMEAVLRGIPETTVDSTISWNFKIHGVTEANVQVAQWALLADHLQAVDRLADKQQMQRIAEVILQVLEVDPSGSHDGPYVAGTMSSIAAHLLENATFYELSSLRSALVPKLLARLCALVREAVSPVNEWENELCALLDGLGSGGTSSDVAREAMLRLLNAEGPPSSIKASPKLSVMERTIRLLQGLNLFPTVYFSNAERDTLLSILFATQYLLCHHAPTDPHNYQHVHVSALHIIAIIRKLEERLVLSREDKLFTTAAPAVLEWYIRTAEGWLLLAQRDERLEPYAQAIANSTVKIQSLGCKKLYQLVAVKGSSAAAAECAGALMAFLSKYYQDRSSGLKYQLLLQIVRPAALWLDMQPNKGGEEKSEVGKRLAFSTVEFLETVRQDACLALSGVTNIDKGAENWWKSSDFSAAISVAREAYSIIECLLSCVSTDADVDTSGEMLSFLAEKMTGAVRTLCHIQEYQKGSLPGLTSLCAEMVSTLTMYHEMMSSELNGSSTRNLLRVFQLLMSTAISRGATSGDTVDKILGGLLRVIRDATEPDYTDLVDFYLEEMDALCIQLSSEVSRRVDQSDASVIALIKAVSVVVSTDNQAVGRRPVKKSMAKFLIKLHRIMHVTTTADGAVEILRLLAHISTDKFLPLYASDVGLISAAMSSMLVPGSRLSASLPSPGIRKDPKLVPSGVLSLYDGVYRVLHALLRTRKDLLVEIIPGFIGLLKQLVQCFRSAPRLETPSRKVPRSNALGSMKMSPELEPSSILAQYGPLPSGYAENLARLMVALGQKSVSSSGGLKVPAVITSSAATVKPFSKHATFLLSNIIQVQISARPFTPEAKAVLAEGIYALLDLCGDHGRESLLAALDPHSAGRPLLKALVAEWEKVHKFKGKV